MGLRRAGRNGRRSTLVCQQHKVGHLSTGSFHILVVAMEQALRAPYSESCVAWVGQERDDYGIRI